MKNVTEKHAETVAQFETAYTVTRDLVRTMRKLAKGSSFAMKRIDDGAIKAATEAHHAAHIALFTYIAVTLRDDECIAVNGTDGEWTAERAARQVRDAGRFQALEGLAEMLPAAEEMEAAR